MDNPLVSVVVIGRNEGARLRRCLQSIRAMRMPQGSVDLIYVDSGSSDQSPQTAAAAGARVIPLEGGRFTPSRGRDAGWRAASAPIIFFVDGDTVVDPNFVARALPEFHDPRVGVVFGSTRELDPNASLFSRAFDMQWQRFSPGPAEYFMGSSLIRRSALEAVNGWDAVLMGGAEAELCGRLKRLEFVFLCIDAPMLAHELAMTSWSRYWWRMVRNGYACAEIVERFPHELPDLRSRTRHTTVWGTLLLLSPVAAIGGSMWSESWLPLGILTACWAGAMFHAAWNARRKAASPLNSLVFGVHVYLKEFPRLVGHLNYHYDKRTGRKTLIEYKTCTRTVYHA